MNKAGELKKSISSWLVGLQAGLLADWLAGWRIAWLDGLPAVCMAGELAGW